MSASRGTRPPTLLNPHSTTFRVIPVALAGVSLLLTALSGDNVSPSSHLPWLVALTAVALAYRWWWDRSTARRATRIAGFVGHTALCAVLVVLAPLFGFYAFTGYLDAVVLFTGVPLAVSVVAVASTTALSQIGGLAGVRQATGVYAVLVTVNSAVAWAMTSFAIQREGERAELEDAVHRLELAEHTNAALQEQLLRQARDTGILDERQRLSRELHDTVAQGLIGIITQLDAYPHVSREDGERRVALASRTAREALTEARRAVRALASPHLDRADLPDALTGLVASVGDLYAIRASMVVDGHPRATSLDGELFRVAQEALTNAGRHSGSSRLVVTLTYLDDEVRLDVCDDGTGFDPGHVTYGHGLRGIGERVANAGGEVHVETTLGAGCTVSAAIPA